MSERLPAPVAVRVAASRPTSKDVVVLPPGTQVLRVHRLGGRYPSAWNQMRAFGPTNARFDHQPPPPRVHPRRSVMYGAIGSEAFTTAIAEFFQDDTGTVATIDRLHDAPAATAFTLAAPVRLLDLGSGWTTRAGGNQALVSGARSRARSWARAIHRAHSDIDGLCYPSSVWGPGRCVVLWERARSALPARNDLHRLLSDPTLDRPLTRAAQDLGALVLP